MKTLLLAAALVAMAGSANAQRFSNLTGAKLIEFCTSKEPRHVEGCTAYIDGIADTSAFYMRLRPQDGSKGALLPGYICIPPSTTGVQLRTAVMDWFKKHADQGQRQASGIVLRALDETFMCPGEQRRLPAAP